MKRRGSGTRKALMIKPDPWLDSRTKPTFGAISEDTVGIFVMNTSDGETVVARPLVDLGFDGYPRRVGTMLVAQFQLKSRRRLQPNGSILYHVPVGALHPDPNATIIFLYFPPPGPEAHEQGYAIPVSSFIQNCPIITYQGRRYFNFVAGMRGHERKWKAYVVELHHLQQQWLDRLPGWGKRSVHRRPAAAPKPEGGREHKLRGAYAEWFVAGQVQIAGGSKVVVARHEVRVDCVGLLVHDLTTYQIGGLAVHSGLIRGDRRFALNIEAGNFFADDRLWFVILGAHPDGTFSETAYVIPSSEIPHLCGKAKDSRGKLHYQTQIPADHITAKWRASAVPTKDLGKTIVERVRQPEPKGNELRAA